VERRGGAATTMGCSEGKERPDGDDERINFGGHRSVDTFNVIILGDASVGKTSICQRAITSTFDEGTATPTIGMNLELSLMVRVAGAKQVKLTFFDTCGQERFAPLARSFIRPAHVIIFAYDITNRATF